MSLILALMAQTATLEAGKLDAAKTCARATAIAHSGMKTQMQAASEYMFYVIHATIAEQSTEPVLTRLQILSMEASKGPTLSAEDATAITAQCEKRFPMPSTAVVRLPADPFERELMCYGVLSLLGGAAQQTVDDGGDGAALGAIDRVLKPLAEKMTDPVLRAHGIDNQDSFQKAFGARIAQSVQLGEPVAISTACGVVGL